MAINEVSKRRRALERHTKKVISIESSPTAENILKCNQQSQSPLFGRFPPEIRNEIFSLALLQYEDVTKPYRKNRERYRPGHRAPHIISTNLLLTCRRIWLEANHWPMEHAVHSFWGYYDDSGYDRDPEVSGRSEDGLYYHSDDVDFEPFNKKLTVLQRSRVKHIHVFTPVSWLDMYLDESFLWKALESDLTNLHSFTITIRHVDWWKWDKNRAPRISKFDLYDSWIKELIHRLLDNRFDEFRLELETLEGHVDKLRQIVDKVKLLKPVDGRGWESHDDVRWQLIEPVAETTWSGPTDIGFEDKSISQDHDKLDYRVFTLKWKRLDSQLPQELEQQWEAEGSLIKTAERGKYHGLYISPLDKV